MGDKGLAMTYPHAGMELIPQMVTGDEKADEALIATYVRLDPYRPGWDRARVIFGNDSVPIWALIGNLRGGGGIPSTAADYAVPEEAVAAAVAYYHRHQIVIDHLLATNDTAVCDGRSPTP